MSRSSVQKDERALAEFFGKRGWTLDQIVQPKIDKDGSWAPDFEFTAEAVAELSRAIQEDPTLYAQLFPGMVN